MTSAACPSPAFSARLPAAMAAALLMAFALYQGLATKNQRDLFIYRLGAEFAIGGENPYDVDAIQRRVAAEYPEADENTRQFVSNCGYFLPPEAIVLFVPLALLPAAAAKVCWAVLLGIAAYLIALLPQRLLDLKAASPSRLIAVLLPFVLVLNPLAIAVVVVGQMAILSTGCLAAGLWCLDRNRPYCTAFLWAVPFIKPHVAVLLIPLLWFLAGWRPAFLLAFVVTALNLIGATIVGGSPLFLSEYLNALGEAHKTVGFNRVETNPGGLTSWNCLLYIAGGPLVELSILTTLAGYLVWLGLIVGRVAIVGHRPPASWAVAAAAVGAVLCAQSLRYEMLVLALVVPWVRDLFAGGHRLWAWQAVWFLAIPLIPTVAWIPPSLMVALLAVVVCAAPRTCGDGSATLLARAAS